MTRDEVIVQEGRDALLARNRTEKDDAAIWRMLLRAAVISDDLHLGDLEGGDETDARRTWNRLPM